MISASIKSIFLVVVLLSLARHVRCGPFKLLRKLEPYSNTNYTKHSKVTGKGIFPITEDDFNTDNRIVGGYYARRNQFPFMAVVHRLIGGGVVAQCGGSVISHRWVLTAGHCVGTNPSRFLLVFGIIDKSGIGYDYYDGPGLAMITDEAYLHPNFDPTINDVGLLRTPYNIPFGENIQPIQLAGFNDIDPTNFANRMGIVIGWGKDGPSGLPTRKLKFAVLPIISDYECKSYWSITVRKHACTAAGYGQDACQGDSGGPLIVLESGTPLQIGIVSYGDGYCPSDKPGVFSRVTGYIDWIQKLTGLNF
ncbi:chymotrypsin-2 [Calliopsis andreniformis]|uniref:chymotrypsin-2 n=1 Tax=Calliopsis andreniformis TaxID=337506 RepID=UPI003FCC5542